MAVGRVSSIAANQLLQSSMCNKTPIIAVHRAAPLIITSLTRNLSTLKLSKNLALITGDDRSVKVVNLKLSDTQQRPLVVLLSWMMAKPKHVHKYANYYIDKGFDVLNISTSPWQLMWPVTGSQVIASDVLNFLDINKNYEPIVIHGFSVGAYQWGEVLVHIANDKERYRNVLDRIGGHIWDSVGDVSELTTGISKALLNNLLLQKLAKQCIILHLYLFRNMATKHYYKSSEVFHSNLVKSPALFLLSKADVVAPISSSEQVKDNWEKAGLEVHWKVWEKSPHVGHFHSHPAEYTEQLDNFLNRIGISSQDIKLRSKL